MASPPFEVEDQDDEDFFDRLIEDDDEFDFKKPGSSVGVEDGGIDEVKEISNLNTSEVVSSGVEVEPGGEDIGSDDQAGKGSDDGVNLAPLDANDDNSSEQSNLTTLSDVNHSGEMAVGEKCASDDTLDKAGVGLGTGPKEVQWISFGSDGKVRDLSGSESFSDFFNEFGDNSEDPFMALGSKDDSGAELSVSGVAEFSVTGVAAGNMATDLASTSHLQNHEGQSYDSRSGESADAQNLSDSQYWEKLYPGWRYDPSTGQWHQLEGYDVNGTANDAISNVVISNQNSDVNYLQQAAQSGMESVSEDYATASVSNWNQNLQGNNGYPAHMIFDPQYPGWYYDTIAQEWRTLESYAPATDHSANADYNLQHQDTDFQNYVSQGVEQQKFVASYGESEGHYSQQNMNMWQTHSVSENVRALSSQSKQLENLYSSNGSVGNLVEQQSVIESSGLVSPYKQVSQTVDSSNELSGFPGFIPTEQYSQNHNQNATESSLQLQFKPAYFDTQKFSGYSNHSLQSGSHFAFATTHGRSSDGRPPHALVTFGFGGKLIILKSNTWSPSSSAYGSQDSVGGVVNVLNLMEVVTGNTIASCSGLEDQDYFHTLCQQSFPGPLVGGSVGNKEVSKWIDERIANSESSDWDYRRKETLRVLLSLLKIACQYYGKLRSPFGADEMLKGSDCPESAVGALFGSAKKWVQSSEYAGLKYCLQNLPSEADLQATAFEVQKLLVSGRKKEALERAQEGQLWGPALVLASQLGDQFFGETVKQMAIKHLMAGSPLRTLCLLIAGQPADVFSSASPSTNLPGYVNSPYQPGQFGANMLDDWEENLAVITANRTKDDELVIIHLGDSLWRERSEVIAAHICYVIAEANFEPYSDSSRLCLLGADHWKFPRTYASPAAIQRTEVYEFSKTLGNSQFLLLPFQPYKLVYACMLAEVGKVADSLKYCQAILKSLKTGRAPEVDTWKQLVSSLEERLRIHQQSGYSANLAPTKLVGKLLTFIDSTAHRVVGGLPPPAPSTHGSIQLNEFGGYPGVSNASVSLSTMTTPPVPSTSHGSFQLNEFGGYPGPGVSNAFGSLSTMTAPPLVPSASMEPISEWTGQNNQSIVPNRSVSEPDFGRSPVKANTSNETNTSKIQEKAAAAPSGSSTTKIQEKAAAPPSESSTSKIQEKAAAPSGPSRFGRFGSQLFQKTVGLVIRSRPHNQAKLGDTNKFYYDEKLKRWVEEGAEPPAEESALPPPPTTSAFQGGLPDYSKGDAPKMDNLQTNSGSEIKSLGSSERNSGIPPIPASSNQFSSRARLGARSRYVDTFNKSGGGDGGMPSSFFQSPSIPSAKPAGGANPKFFIPAPVPSSTSEEVIQNTVESSQGALSTTENPSTSLKDDSSPPMSSPGLAFPPVTMQRFPSMDHITRNKTEPTDNQNSDLPHSRRTVSWSGSLGQNSPGETEIKPLAEPMSTSFYSPPSLNRHDSQVSNSGDELIL